MPYLRNGGIPELQALVFGLWTPFHLCIWWALNPGETNKGNKAPNQQGGSGLEGICWAQFLDRSSYDSCLSKPTPMVH